MNDDDQRYTAEISSLSFLFWAENKKSMNIEHEMIIIIFYNFSLKFPISLNSNSSNKMLRITTARHRIETLAHNRDEVP